MTNVVPMNAAAPVDLDEVVRRIAEHASKTVENVWHIGNELNRAKACFSDDQSFGAWRREHITQPLGIADRTQRTFMRIATNWKLEQLPQFLGITALADVASLPEVQQREALGYLTTAAEEGKRVPVSTATMVVKAAREGASAADIHHRYDPAAIPGTVDVEPIAPVQRERPAAEEPVVIDGDTGEVDRAAAPEVPAPAGRAADAPETWAKRVVAQLRQQNGHRRDYLGALWLELQAAGMLERKGEATIRVEGKAKKAKLVVGS